MSQQQRVAKTNPPPDTYNPNFSQVEQRKFHKIGFGIGERMAPMQRLASPNKKERMYVSVPKGEMTCYPGPDAYNIPSAFDRFKK